METTEEELRLALEKLRKAGKRAGFSDAMERARGMIDSGIPDLATNPKYLEDLGRDVDDR